MKEVTRIHIAKITYEIEVPAKKRLEAYIDTLTEYADDENVVEDIEIRITELLESYNTKPGGIITLSDVEKIQETLGEPKDFLDEEKFSVENEDVKQAHMGRKFYRDIDNAVLGGVLSGFAAYLNVNALWVRLAFIVLLFVSFGFAAFIYVLFWIITPPAKTVTDKLLMKGMPVTLGSIRKYNDDQIGEKSTKDLLERRRRVFGITVGIMGALGAIGALLVTIGGVSAWFIAGEQTHEYISGWEVLSLLIASGVLLTLLGAIISYAGFNTRVTKKIVLISCGVIVAGMLSFSAAIGLMGYQSWQRNDAIQKSVTEQSVTLPNNFAIIKQLTVDMENIHVAYQVSNDTRATLTSVPGPKVVVAQDGDKAILRMTGYEHDNMFAYTPTLTIYGPELASVEVVKGYVDYAAKNQELKTDVSEGASLSLTGNYTILQGDIKDSGSLSAESASVRSVNLVLHPSANAGFSNIETIDMTMPTACPSGTRAQVSVQNIGSGSFTLNGAKSLAKSINNACWIVDVNNDGSEGPTDEY